MKLDRRYYEEQPLVCEAEAQGAGRVIPNYTKITEPTIGELLRSCNSLFEMAPRIRFERTTFPLGGGRSILLSYRGV